MSSQAFLLINLGFAVVVIVIFLLGRLKARAPAKLSMRYGKSTSASNSQTSSQMSVEVEEIVSDGQVKNLNPIFIFNGHSWDAFEVLGLPAGSGSEAVQQAYDIMVGKSDKQSRDFFDAALNAISLSRK